MSDQANRPAMNLSRRAMLKSSGIGLGMLGLAGILSDTGELSAATSSAKSIVEKSPHFAPRAKRVIHIFLNGGPSQVDTFDPKPALEKYAGQPLPKSFMTERKTGGAMASPFKFQKYGQSGIDVSELFPKMAEHADSMAVIRSMYTANPNHEPSLMLMNCGDAVQPRPSVGAWVLYGLGSENENLPGFVAMSPSGYPIGSNSNWQSGFLPGMYQGTFIDPRYQQIDRLIENIRSPHATTEAQRRQLDLLRRMNTDHGGAAAGADPRLESRIQSFELAFRMQSEAAEAFDLAREPEHIQKAYGETVHGRQTLIARRLLERGVRYVQIWHGAGQPWDHHANINKQIASQSKEIDQPVAALLADLKQRGMLDDTLVIFGGEFGRTPVSEGGSGRDHNPYGFSIWMAGGGIRGGTIYGATDEFGFKAVDKPVSVHDLHATILHLLGFDHEKLTYRHAGRDFRLTDVSGEVIRDVVA